MPHRNYMQSAIRNPQFAIGRPATCFWLSFLRPLVSGLRSAIALAALLFIAAVPAFAADDKTDTVVLGVEGNEIFEWYKSEGYTPANTPAAALAEFGTGATEAKYTRLLILKNAASVAATVSEWTWPSMTLPPGNLKKIEGGSLTKPYDIILHGSSTAALFDFTDVGETDAPFVFQGVTLTGGLNAVLAGGSSNIELDRCYISDNNTDPGGVARGGVVVAGNADAKFTNCVFFKNRDGIRVEGTAKIIHCTFFDSKDGGNGIYVAAGGSANLKNTLMYSNEYGIYSDGAVIAAGCNSYDSRSGINFFPPSLEGIDGEQVDLLAQPWQGKLAATQHNLLSLQYKGVGGTDVPIDFEGDGRGAPPFIGADELNTDPTIGSWSKCEVYTEPIGRNGADVVINYSGPISDLDNSLYLVPQGVEINETLYHIKVPLKGADGVYWGEIQEINGPVLGETDEKVFISDGEGRFILRPTASRILDNSDERKYIVGQAVTGRRPILIDTIEPVLDVTSYNLATLVNWSGGATNFAAIGVPWGTYAFPYPGITGYPQVVAPGASSSGAVFAPYPVFPPYADLLAPLPEFPKYIYNVGSVANGYITGDDWLVLTITARYIDRDVYAATGYESPGSRPTSGFDSIAPENGPQEKYFSDAWVADGFPAAWRLDQQSSVLSNPASIFGFTCTGDQTNLVATWNLTVPVTGPGGALLERFHLLGDFIATDKAGNYLTSIDRSRVPPLQISYLSGYGTRVDFRTRMYGAWPEVAWSLNNTGLNINRENEANPRPIYSYNIWGARSNGIYTEDNRYENPTGWSGWSPQNVLSASFFDQNISDNFGYPITDRWLIVVVGGCDEAGNVTPWDYEALEQNADADGSINLVSGATSGRNWVRFYIPGKTTQIDTVLYANLYYLDESGARRDLGPAPIVSFPPPGVRLMAEFNARILLNDPALWGSAWLKVTCQQNGISVFGFSPGYIYMPTSGTDMVYFELPYEGAPPQLGDASNVMTYTISAAALADTGADPLPEDQTPATFSFKVVPGSVDDYLRSSGGQQPVKQFETR